MRKHVLLAVGVAVLAGGCSLLGAPDAVKTANQTIASEDAVALDLQNSHLEQTRALLLISRGTYECGDPKDRVNRNSPAASRRTSDDERTDAAKAALELLNAYQKTLDAIVDRTKKKLDSDGKVFGNAQKAVEGIGIIPAAAPFTAAASSAIALMSAAVADVNTQAANRQMVEYAKGMKGVLAVAVDTLKRNYQSFSVVGESAFRAWDACARESLYYMRDIAGRGIYLKNGTRLEAFVAPSSGVELENAWHAYRGKRAEFRGRLVSQQDYNRALDDVVTQNDALAAGQKINIEATAAAISDLAGKAQKACEDFQKASNNPELDICKKKS